MGVQRKNPRLSILGSFFMIIIAGSIYRISRVNQKIVKSKVSDILSKFGNKIYSNSNFYQQKVLPSQGKLAKGEQGELLTLPNLLNGSD